MSINKAIVVGHLGRDPEIRALPSGQSIASFSLATTDITVVTVSPKSAPNGIAWSRSEGSRKTASVCLPKRREVYVEGRLNTRQYQAKNGADLRYRTEIAA
jgi:single-strand DNA-binding protein